MRSYEECRPYVNHLVAQHRRLHFLLAEAVNAIRSHGMQNSSEVVEILCGVRNELARHFREEEAGGCLEEAVNHCPRLADAEKRIEAEHPDLLAALDKVIDQAFAPFPLATQISGDFAKFCSKIHAQEEAENDLLKEGFGTISMATAINS